MIKDIIKYIEDVNKISEEIKAIKSADCIMDYDAKTEIINQKMKAISQLNIMVEMLSQIQK